MTNAFESIIPLLSTFPIESINDATIDAICTLIIPLCDNESLTESDCFDLLRIIDDRSNDDDALYFLNIEILDTLRDNSDFKLLI